MSTKVTIGIPVYNAGKYVEKCILSVLEQTLEDIEILIIDDHGEDNSIDIISSIAKNHPRGKCIKIVDHGKNQGVANARNSIIENSTGKYIFFLDQDDYIFPNSIELLYNKAESTKAETIWGSYYAEIAETGERLYKEEHIYNDLYLFGQDKLVLYDCIDIHDNLQQSVWNILFLKKFFTDNNLKFEPYGHFDDVIMQAKMQPLITKAVLISNITYIWYMHEGSGSNFQYREHINIKEFTNAVEGINVIKEYYKTLAYKDYYDVKCVKIMKWLFFVVCGYIKHRNQMNERINNGSIKLWIKHPATLRQIFSFKKYKKENLAFWLLGQLPSAIIMKAIEIIGKKKGFI